MSPLIFAATETLLGKEGSPTIGDSSFAPLIVAVFVCGLILAIVGEAMKVRREIRADELAMTERKERTEQEELKLATHSFNLWAEIEGESGLRNVTSANDALALLPYLVLHQKIDLRKAQLIEKHIGALVAEGRRLYTKQEWDDRRQYLKERGVDVDGQGSQTA